MAIAPELYLENDLILEIGPMTKVDPATGVESLATGLVVTCLIAATNGIDAAAINAALSITLTEDGATAVYRGSIDGGVLKTHLNTAPYLDAKVYLHFQSGDDFHVVGETTVRSVRAVS
jgi:hypothetical protein